MQMVPSVLTGKRQNDLRTLYTHLKGKNINTLTYSLSNSGRINLHDDFFQTESPSKPVKN